MKMTTATAALIDALVRHGRLVRGTMIGLMALSVLLDVLKPSHYSRFPWDGIPGFTAVFAFLGALLLIGVYKAIGYGLVYRQPDYYGDDDHSGDDHGASGRG
jgi:hypothetical protein